MAFQDFFRKLFKADTVNTAGEKESPDTWAKNRFETEVQELIKRYNHPGDAFQLMEPGTTKNILFADYYPGVYEQWLKIKSLHDRRQLIYKMLENLLWDKLKLWKKADNLLEARFPLKAYQLFKESVEPFREAGSPEEDIEMYHAVRSKLYIIMAEYDRAIMQLLKGLELLPASKALKIQLAEYYYAISASEKYQELMQELLPDLEPSKATDINIIFDELFAYHSGILRSVAFAAYMGFSLANPEQSKVFWERAESEFYYHPLFRLEQARYVLENRDKESHNDVLRALAIYIKLLEEMPWQKEAAVNAMAIMEAFKINNEKYIFVRNIIEKNGWTSDGTNNLSV